MDKDLDSLLKSTPYLCRGTRFFSGTLTSLSTGYAKLDAILPGGGWPLGAVTEFLAEAMGIGELRLLLPAIREVTHQKQRVLMINTPYRPYAPALVQAGVDLNYLYLIFPTNREDALWAAEKVLHSGGCKVVLLWPDGFGHCPVGDATVRRLQVAAQATGSITVLYRSSSRGISGQSNWATLRLRLSAENKGLKVEVLKAFGSIARSSVILDT